MLKGLLNLSITNIRKLRTKNVLYHWPITCAKTLSITTLSKMTLSITTMSTTILSITIKNATLSISLFCRIDSEPERLRSERKFPPGSLSRRRPVTIRTSGPDVIKLFTSVIYDKPECLSLAIFSSLDECLWLKPGAHPRTEHLNELTPALPTNITLKH
jgi:hypothetical protein